MKKILFGLFAHPDDEANGPSGTLIKMARDGTDIHLLCLTDGKAGMNIDSYTNLAEVRSKEWQAAGKLIGAKTMQQFNYGDGTLCNNMYHEIATLVEKHIKNVLESYQEPVEINFMTFGNNGLTGHIDHLAASAIATYIFVRLKNMPASSKRHIGKLRYFYFPPSKLDHDVSYVYFPAGLAPEAADEVVDIASVADQKRAVMKAHYSQRSDTDMLCMHFPALFKQELFRFF